VSYKFTTPPPRALVVTSEQGRRFRDKHDGAIWRGASSPDTWCRTRRKEQTYDRLASALSYVLCYNGNEATQPDTVGWGGGGGAEVTYERFHVVVKPQPSR
jgi:hypothetical protein